MCAGVRRCQSGRHGGNDKGVADEEISRAEGGNFEAVHYDSGVVVIDCL